MKKQIQIIRFLFLATFLLSGLNAQPNNQMTTKDTPALAHAQKVFSGTFSYAWKPSSGAISYTVTITDINTQHSYSWVVTTNTISASNITTGTYALTVKANYSTSAPSIIIQDVVEH